MDTSIDQRIERAIYHVRNAEENLTKNEKDINRYVREITNAHKKGKVADVRHYNHMLTHSFSSRDTYLEWLEDAQERLTRLEREKQGFGVFDDFLEELLQEDIGWHKSLRSLDYEGRKKLSKTEKAFAQMSEAEALKVFKNDIAIRRVKFTKQVTEKVGSILHLELMRNGNSGFDGYVECEKGRASIETIIAGGYNIQRRHYRTLIKPIKE